LQASDKITILRQFSFDLSIRFGGPRHKRKKSIILQLSLYKQLMIFTELQLSGVFTVSPQRHDDERGFFSESFREDKFSAAIEQSPNFVQDNVVLSGSKNTIRGLHFPKHMANISL
jgi:hypothetical protein